MTVNVSEIINELSDTVFRVIFRIVPDRDEAVDLTQELFVRLFTGRQRLQDKSKIKPYILRAAVNTALNYRRDNLRRQSKVESIKDFITPNTPLPQDIALERKETTKTVNKALRLLSGKQREAIVLRFYGELSFAEIAGTMGIREGSVKVHVARGLINLKERLISISKEVLHEM